MDAVHLPALRDYYNSNDKGGVDTGSEVEEYKEMSVWPVQTQPTYAAPPTATVKSIGNEKEEEGEDAEEKHPKRTRSEIISKASSSSLLSCSPSSAADTFPSNANLANCSESISPSSSLPSSLSDFAYAGSRRIDQRKHTMPLRLLSLHSVRFALLCPVCQHDILVSVAGTGFECLNCREPLTSDSVVLAEASDGTGGMADVALSLPITSEYAFLEAMPAPSKPDFSLSSPAAASALSTSSSVSNHRRRGWVLTACLWADVSDATCTASLVAFGPAALGILALTRSELCVVAKLLKATGNVEYIRRLFLDDWLRMVGRAPPPPPPPPTRSLPSSATSSTSEAVDGNATHMQDGDNKDDRKEEEADDDGKRYGRDDNDDDINDEDEDEEEEEMEDAALTTATSSMPSRKVMNALEVDRILLFNSIRVREDAFCANVTCEVLHPLVASALPQRLNALSSVSERQLRHVLMNATTVVSKDDAEFSLLENSEKYPFNLVGTGVQQSVVASSPLSLLAVSVQPRDPLQQAATLLQRLSMTSTVEMVESIS